MYTIDDEPRYCDRCQEEHGERMSDSGEEFLCLGCLGDDYWAASEDCRIFEEWLEEINLLLT